LRDLEALPAERRQERSFELWTLKEAFSKALGVGMSLEWQKFSFEFGDAAASPIRLRGRSDDDGVCWRFALARPTPEHCLAAAYTVEPGVPVHLRQQFLFPAVDCRACLLQGGPTAMRAMLLERSGQPLREAEVPLPRPAADEVLVEVRACGVCRTDLHVV